MTEREKLVSENLGLVHSCANKFRNRGIDYDDLYQAGCVGLLKAINGFDKSLGFEFSTYAVPAILGEIKRIFRDGGAIKVSRSLKEQARTVLKEKEKLSEKLGREPTVKELAEYMDMDTYKLSDLLLSNQAVLSLTCADDESKKELDISVENQDSIDEQITLKDCINQLCEDDKKIISLRYYKAKTQSDVAKTLGMTQVQVSRREKMILKEIREKMTV